MPQLNPAPWLFILLLSWTTILLIFKTKILSSHTLNSTMMTSPLKHQHTPWIWPWT
uniref:ATP synthase complex subunit 8 n=1 Tax=Sphenomorphus incognitus TaxID=889765 RepID=A0A493QZZ6_9SAUR|nr:ATP synthase F0 subunit 8 [Sphenomorphus incognitus]QAV57721.1 ATP synthase F0 subunit 8 [Sphenomorphus incognitus]